MLYHLPFQEEELRNQGDPKYSHLNEDLHVEISAYAAPPEAYRRMSFAIAEIQRFLVPVSALSLLIIVIQQLITF